MYAVQQKTVREIKMITSNKGKDVFKRSNEKVNKAINIVKG